MRSFQIDVPRDKMEEWSDIRSNQGIPLKRYYQVGKIAPKQIILTPIIPEYFNHSFVDILWTCAHLFNKKRLS